MTRERDLKIFVLQENIVRFRRQMQETPTAEERRVLEGMIAEARRELSTLKDKATGN